MRSETGPPLLYWTLLEMMVLSSVTAHLVLHYHRLSSLGRGVAGLEQFQVKQ